MRPPPQISVIIPTHNPDRNRLQCTLSGLAAQTLPHSQWELLVIDNGTTDSEAFFPGICPALEPLTVVKEPRLGLTHARVAGIATARAEVLVFVDDDNVLAPNYLADALEVFSAYPKIGAAGGPTTSSFETPPPSWTREFFPLLALRDLGKQELVSHYSPGERITGYPAFAPIGAGMVLRRECGLIYQEALRTDPRRLALDRKGQSLSSGGDNDLVLTILEAGWQVGYFPRLALTHLIPARRLESDYLARLQHDLARSWIIVLGIHGINPWPPVSRHSVFLRKVRSWFRHQAWRGAAHYIRWRGTCGSFEGRSLIAPS